VALVVDVVLVMVADGFIDGSRCVYHGRGEGKRKGRKTEVSEKERELGKGRY